jgi:EAL domain-containing protein (putative c-di-GMP-specific phosphodiesterase class I)
MAVAEKVRGAIHEFQFVHGERSFWLAVSIGIVLPEPGVDTFEMALADADRACYQAKEEGRNRVRRYEPSDHDMVERRAEMDWVSRLRSAIEENRMRLYTQPIVPVSDPDNADGHEELLLRLVDERGSLVSPMAFIPAAERYGLMPSLDRWVVEAAFSRYARLVAARRMTGAEVWAINLSGATLGDEDFPAFVKRQFALHQLRQGVICFEVTETAAIGNLSRARRFMLEMKALGCSFALDDFGAGASSFSYLQNLPVDYLKIDASFVTDLLNNPVKEAMVRAINQIGHVMGIKTIVEGVESSELLPRLDAIGIDYAQGYAFGKPQPLGEERRTDNWNRGAAVAQVPA